MRANLLLVEDEPGLILALGDRLRAEGYAVEVADDGRKGLDRASTTDFDLVLLDVMLPGLSGLEVCRQLRARGRGRRVRAPKSARRRRSRVPRRKPARCPQPGRRCGLRVGIRW